MACEHLRQQGLKLLTRNYHCRRGEIDLVMRDKGSLVFVEVRYRRQARYGSASESVNWHKQQRLIAAAKHYLLHEARTRPAARFDVVAISGAGADLELEWIHNAFGT
ncbi:MAG: YraN family protein [Gammaproteobacteria bacterium]|nr:YraN family protein [Gammaproteobacteria bacterium]